MRHGAPYKLELSWDIFKPDQLINLEINNKRTTSLIYSGDLEKDEIKH